MLDRELVQHVIQPIVPLIAAQPSGFKDRQNVLLHCHLAEDGGLLRQIADSISRALVHRHLGELNTVHPDTTLVRADEARNKVEGRGLSRAVRSEKSNDFSLLYSN